MFKVVAIALSKSDATWASLAKSVEFSNKHPKTGVLVN